MKSLLATALVLWSAQASAQYISTTVPGGLPSGSMINVAQYGALGNGGDDTAGIQAALNAGVGLVQCSAGKTYRVTKRIDYPLVGTNGRPVGLVGPCTIYAPATAFNNTSQASVDRYGTNAVVFNLSGQTVAPFTANNNPALQNITIFTDVLDGRVLHPVVARNVVNPTISGLEIYNFPVGVGITAASAIKGRIENNYIHDWTSNLNWASLPQITGIEFDNDIINGVLSTGTIISINTISDLTVGATLIAAWGYQTDGINLANSGAQGLVITNNRIVNVGEGIDNFSSHATISNNTAINTYNFCYKLIHGAQYNTVSGNTCDQPGLAGFSIGINADYNTIVGNVCTNVDPNGVWAASESACWLSNATDGTAVFGNNVIGNTFIPGANGKQAVVDRAVGPNTFTGNLEYTGATGFVVITDPKSPYIPAIPTAVQAAQLATPQSLVAGATATLVMEDVILDRRGEYNNTTYTWTPQIPGTYRITGSVRVPNFTAGTKWSLGIYVNGSVAGGPNLIQPFAGTEGTVVVTGDIICAVGDAVTLRVTSGEASSARNTSNAINVTFLNINGPI